MAIVQDQERPGIKNPRRISIGAINKKTLDKKLNVLSDNEKEQFCYLRDQILWAKKNGYFIVLTRNNRFPFKIDCWMIRKTSMPFLDFKFKKKIYHVF